MLESKLKDQPFNTGIFTWNDTPEVANVPSAANMDAVKMTQQEVVFCRLPTEKQSPISEVEFTALRHTISVNEEFARLTQLALHQPVTRYVSVYVQPKYFSAAWQDLCPSACMTLVLAERQGLTPTDHFALQCF